MHRSDDIKVKYQIGDFQLIQYQILQIDIKRIVCQTVQRITDEILVVQIRIIFTLQKEQLHWKINAK